MRTRYQGALRDWVVKDPETGQTCHFRVAYIHSSEEHEEVALARERALLKAEEALQRVRRGLGGRHYKTTDQVQRRVGQIVGENIRGLITVTVGEHAGKPTIGWQRERVRFSV